MIGGSIAGLLAARALSDAFSEVIVFDRDTLPTEPNPRRGVPQSTHVHVLLEAGRVALERLLPGFESEIRAAGGLTIDAASDLRYFHRGDFLAPGPDPLPMVCASRPLFEHSVRERVEAIPNVTIESSCGVTDMPCASGAVSGVRVGDAETVAGDVVVDATGRSSPLPGWLARQGYARPATAEVTIDLTYASRTIARPPDDRTGYLIAPSPANPRGGTVIPIEGGRWMVTLFGVHGRHPPGAADGFRAFAERLPTPEPSEVLAQTTPNTEAIHRYPFPSNRWYRYDTLQDLPAGFVATGDAVASFNPIYGQGMSVAALDALYLHETLRKEGGERITGPYFRRIGGTIRTIWRMTVGADFEFGETEGPRPTGTRVFNWYLSRLVRAAHEDGILADAFARVLRLERPPATLFHPRVLRRVFLP